MTEEKISRIIGKPPATVFSAKQSTTGNSAIVGSCVDNTYFVAIIGVQGGQPCWINEEYDSVDKYKAGLCRNELFIEDMIL